MRDQRSGQLRVIKTSFQKTDRESFKWKILTSQEANALMKLCEIFVHSNIIDLAFVDVLPTGHTLLALEYCSGGDLLSQIHRFSQNEMATPALFVLQCLIGFGEVIAFCHHALIYVEGQLALGEPRCRQGNKEPPRLAHLDIKPEKIFLRHPLDCYVLPHLC